MWRLTGSILESMVWFPTVHHIWPIFTVRRPNCGKVMCSQACVKNSVRGVYPSMCWVGCVADTPQADTPRRPLQWTVHILLEFTLVFFQFASRLRYYIIPLASRNSSPSLATVRVNMEKVHTRTTIFTHNALFLYNIFIYGHSPHCHGVGGMKELKDVIYHGCDS